MTTLAPLSAQLDAVSVRYGDETALDDVTLTIPAGQIVGLLGRNGSGKTTLLSLLANFRRPSSGRIAVDGEDPFEHPTLARQVAFIGATGGGEDPLRVATTLDIVAALRPTFDRRLAEAMLDRFEVADHKRVASLSQGQRAAVNVAIGLATRAPLTLFDEPHLGMDAPTRYAFYDALLEDYAAHPRTIIMATHHIDEVARLFESVVILERGRVVVNEQTDTLRQRGLVISGPADAVARVLDGTPPLSEQSLGSLRSAVVYGAVADEVRTRASAAGLEVGPVPLQDLFVHLASSAHASSPRASSPHAANPLVDTDTSAPTSTSAPTREIP